VRRVNGFTLIELLIAVAVSMVVVLSMTRLMANTLDTGSTAIGMTRLTQQLRSALELMSRDVRRTSYSSEAVLCYANPDCRTDGSISLPGDITFSTDQDCFIFLHDRNHDGNATNDGAGAFRRVVSNGVGSLQMWVGTDTPACGSSESGWLPITDASVIDVHTFVVNDAPSFTEVIDIDGSGNNVLQKVRKVRLRIGARLVYEQGITRVVEEVIRVRNDMVL
jgi:prepilin-type N-terminal cleavage/methylation domain-containing protein